MIILVRVQLEKSRNSLIPTGKPLRSAASCTGFGAAKTRKRRIQRMRKENKELIACVMEAVYAKDKLEAVRIPACIPSMTTVRTS